VATSSTDMLQRQTRSKSNLEICPCARQAPEPLAAAGPPEAGRFFDVVVANILAGPLVGLAPRLVGYAKPGAALALSGVLAGEQVCNVVSFECLLHVQQSQALARSRYGGSCRSTAHVTNVFTAGHTYSRQDTRIHGTAGHTYSSSA